MGARWRRLPARLATFLGLDHLGPKGWMPPRLQLPTFMRGLAHVESKTEARVSFVARLPLPAPSVEAWLEDRQRRLASAH